MHQSSLLRFGNLLSKTGLCTFRMKKKRCVRLLNGVIPPEHPLDYADVPALVERLKLFFTFEVRSTAGRIDVAVSADNICSWRSSTSRKNETLNMVACARRTVLNFSADGRQGAYEQRKILSNFLIPELGLKSEVKPKEKHCVPEIKLL